MLRSRRGFTLIELVIVIVILGILAAVAIPKFVDLTSQAKQAACKGALGGLRSALSIAYANSVANGTTGTAAWPADPQAQMAAPVPNPYVTDIANNTVVATDGDTARATAGAQGWKYSRANGLIYANTTTDSANTW